ncbi:MAG TPA: ATP-binding cassette domain-containing protein [Mycobacterium sp.]|nr:ATP-binding cassette domain-containing protein [Mycobacterium sp.]
MGDLRIKDLVVEYSGGGEAIHAIDGLDLKITAGSLVIVLGPSGCGKTTLLSCLGGILSPTAGCIEFGDVEITALDRRGLTAYRRHTVGIVFQAFNLVASLTALENVMVPMWAAGWSQWVARQRAAELLTRVGLHDRLTHRPGKLSGGQQQRVAVARAIALDPPLILADEPTAQLDFIRVAEVLELLRSLATGDRIVVVATHDTRILPLADVVIPLVPSFAPAYRKPTVTRLTPGTVLIDQGSVEDLIYIVAQGELEIVPESEGAGERLLKIGNPGDYAGEIGPFVRIPRSAIVRPRTDATVISYTVEAFREQFGRPPEPDESASEPAQPETVGDHEHR